MKHYFSIAKTALFFMVLFVFTACSAVFLDNPTDTDSSTLSRAASYVNSSTARLWIEAADASWVDVHYKVNGGDQLNLRMNRDASYFWYDITGLAEWDSIDYWFTIGYPTGSRDTDWYYYQHTTGGAASTSSPEGAQDGNSFIIEAEDYTYMNGVQTEACSEGGLNVGWIDKGDWIAYPAKTFKEGDYLIEYRVASLNGGGQLTADLDAGSVQLGGLNIASTGGWQNWTTISHTVYITAGEHSFGIYAVSGGWNINWIKFTYLGGSSTPSPQPTPTPSPATGDWTLVWSDEFDGNSFNTAFWTAEIRDDGCGNNELQYYTDRGDNIRVSGGNLEIIARRESYGTKNYTSARLKTQDKVYKTYGKVEARIRLSDTGSGLWPAFWMLGNNISSVGWPACGEIDIMEHINNDPLIHGTIHWDASGHAYYGDSIQADVTQWHVYTIEWDESSIKWFVDGVQYHEANIAGSVNSTEEFHRPFFILLNVAVGGNWPGFTIDDSMFPVTMYVDWVRWYQK